MADGVLLGPTDPLPPTPGFFMSPLHVNRLSFSLTRTESNRTKDTQNSARDSIRTSTFVNSFHEVNGKVKRRQNGCVLGSEILCGFSVYFFPGHDLCGQTTEKHFLSPFWGKAPGQEEEDSCEWWCWLSVTWVKEDRQVYEYARIC
jgi:hypothetical protein